MTERILIRRQGLQRSNRESREKNIGKQCRYDGDGEEREEVDKISFRLNARFYSRRSRPFSFPLLKSFNKRLK